MVVGTLGLENAYLLAAPFVDAGALALVKVSIVVDVTSTCGSSKRKFPTKIQT